MSAEEIDAYLAGSTSRNGAPSRRCGGRSPRDRSRRRTSHLLKVPAFRVHGRIVAGFAASKDHLSYLPFSGSVLPRLADELQAYTTTKSALHFPVDRPLPKPLVKKLIAARTAERASDSS